MTRYKYVAIAIITLLAGYYCSCQCNNPTIIETEPKNYQPENPQSGDPTPSRTWGRGTQSVGKNRGIPRNGCWNTCYMNSTLQVLFALYGDRVKDKCSGAAEGTMAAKMLGLITNVTNPIDGASSNTCEEEKEIESFFKSMKDPKPGAPTKPSINDGIGWWTSDVTITADTSELFASFLEWLDVQSLEVNVRPGVAPEFVATSAEAIAKLPFHVGSTTMQALIDQVNLNKVSCLYHNSFIVELVRSDNVNEIKSNEDIENPLNITIKKTHSDLTEDANYNLVSFIHHNGGYFGGHYTAYIKEDTKWICYNDSSVSMV